MNQAPSCARKVKASDDGQEKTPAVGQLAGVGSEAEAKGAEVCPKNAVPAPVNYDSKHRLLAYRPDHMAWCFKKVTPVSFDRFLRNSFVF